MWIIEINVRDADTENVDELRMERHGELAGAVEDGIAHLRTFAPHSSDLGPVELRPPAWAESVQRAGRELRLTGLDPLRTSIAEQLTGLTPAELELAAAAGVDMNSATALLDWKRDRDSDEPSEAVQRRRAQAHSITLAKLSVRAGGEPLAATAEAIVTALAAAGLL